MPVAINLTMDPPVKLPKKSGTQRSILEDLPSGLEDHLEKVKTQNIPEQTKQADVLSPAEEEQAKARKKPREKKVKPKAQTKTKGVKKKSGTALEEMGVRVEGSGENLMVYNLKTGKPIKKTKVGYVVVGLDPENPKKRRAFTEQEILQAVGK